MSDNKINIVHFHNGTGGGVLSVIRNLLAYSKNENICNHIIFTIEKKRFPNYQPPLIKGAASAQVFYYSQNDNFYYTCKQLAKLLPGDNAVVIAHDWLELGMMSNLGLQNPVVQFVHGDYEYYYQLAVKHEKTIDLYIPVAQNIEKNLKISLPQRTNDITYQRFPVPDVPTQIKERPNKIIFIGRLDASKGYLLLPKIANQLTDKKIQWHIVGSGEEEIKVKDWDKNIPVKFYGNMANSEVLKLLPEMQIIILPSLAEGMPMVLIEAMKAGVIPIVNDLEGGIQELVINNETGFKIKVNDISEFVEKVRMLIDNKNLSMQMQQECMKLANRLFEPVANVTNIEKIIENISHCDIKRKPTIKIYGSRLDQLWLNNFLTYTFRNLLKKY